MKNILSKISFTILILFTVMFTSCNGSVEFFGDVFADIEEKSQTHFYFYTSKTAESAEFSIKFKIGQEISADQLPVEGDERLSNFAIPGYEVSGWKFYRYTGENESDVEETLVTETNGIIEKIKVSADAMDFIPVYKISSVTPYTVNYYLPKLNSTEYDIQSETQYGTTFTTTSVTAKEITGFEFDSSTTIAQQEIKADGSTVVNVYYLRKTVTITFEYTDAAGSHNPLVTKGYGAEFKLSDFTNLPEVGDTTFGNATFAGWYVKTDSTKTLVTLPATYPADDITYVGLWRNKAGGAFDNPSVESISVYVDNNTAQNTINTSIEIFAKYDGTSFNYTGTKTDWTIIVYCNGTELVKNVKGTATGSNSYIEITNDSFGKYVKIKPGLPVGTVLQIYASVESNGISYGGTFDITVLHGFSDSTSLENYLLNNLAAGEEVTIVITGSTLNRDSIAKAPATSKITLDLSQSTITDLNALSNLDCLEKVILPDTVTVLKDSLFNNCHNLKEVVIGSNTTVISQFVFQNTAIESLVIPASVRAIGCGIISGCNINSVTFVDSTSTWTGTNGTDTDSFNASDSVSAVINKLKTYNYAWVKQ